MSTASFESRALTGTKKDFLRTTNSIKSSYFSYRIGRKTTDTLRDIPGDSLMSSGKSMEKNLVCGSLYRIFIVSFDTFFTTSFLA